MSAAVRAIVLLLALAYLAVIAYMYVQQRSLQYFPGRKGLSPGDVGLSGVAEESIRTSDGESIVAWHTAAAEGMPTILFFHGNGGEVADRSERLDFYRRNGFGTLFVSYRGYGRSSGSISEKGLILDALAAHDWLVSRGVPGEQIAVVGESLGTGVAVQLAAQRRTGAVALEAPYTSAADVAAAIYWWLPVRLLMKDPFHSRDHIANIAAPVLVQHGDADTIIPVAHGRGLHALAREPRELTIYAGAGHDVIHRPEVWQREVEFFRRHIPPEAPAQ